MTRPPRPVAEAALEVRFKRGRDGPDSFVIVRPDGSHTRQQDATGGFFPPHDLTHLVVESELGYRRGFFGVVAEGWDLADFGHPWPRGPMPREAIVPEAIVGLFDQETAAGVRWTADEFNQSLGAYLSREGLPTRLLTEAELATIRRRRSELIGRWRKLAAGETLVLSFPLPAEP